MKVLPTNRGPLSSKFSPSHPNLNANQNTYYGQVQESHQWTEHLRCRPPLSMIDFQNYPGADMQVLSAIPLSPPASPYVLSSDINTASSLNDSDIKLQNSFDDHNFFDGFSTHSTDVLPVFRPHSSLSYSNTLEPRMMFYQFGPCQSTNIDLDLHNNLSVPQQDYTYIPSPFAAPAYPEHFILTDDDASPTPTPTDATLGSPPSKQIDDDDDTTDKPYARLIYEALMQKPDHKMMLREIYSWFIENTTKPQESGTNGWQNSIRHNLSMNQAFENDKSTYSPGKGHSRKANSMWMLTDHAVKNGVQSTTRYRKQGTARKGLTNRTPAIQRQKSGSRGGRAARRSAARLKKQEEASKIGAFSSLGETMPYLHQANMGVEDVVTGQTQAPQQEHRPATPTVDGQSEPLYSLPAVLHAFDTEQLYKTEQGDFFDDAPKSDDYIFLSSGSPILDREIRG